MRSAGVWCFSASNDARKKASGGVRTRTPELSLGAGPSLRVLAHLYVLYKGGGDDIGNREWRIPKQAASVPTFAKTAKVGQPPGEVKLAADHGGGD